MNAIELSLFVSRMESVCEEMGAVLKRTAFSPNIKDRLDFSCALFDAQGELCAQAAHIPVHLGSMAFAMVDIINRFEWQEGDIVILNDPFLGGTHLPDVTVLQPVFSEQQLAAFVVNRAHHANIGADTPGSMPNSSSLHEEGLIIAPQFLYRQGKLNQKLATLLQSLCGQFPRPESLQDDRQIRAADFGGDIAAQLSALHTGKQRLKNLIGRLGYSAFQTALVELNQYGEKLAAAALEKIPAGSYRFNDVMDDAQARGNVNCPLSVTAAAVFYVFRCLMPEHTPACAGIFRRISILAPEACLINAQYPAAVVAGNVETSSRIVDVVLGALQQALPDQIPAASQGSMNNIAMGHYATEAGESSWDYYETLAGGMGAGPHGKGLSAVHTHMTNTLNTPVESLELHYPLRILAYAIRTNSGGRGLHVGGDGLTRVYEFLSPTQLSILSERRTHVPWGLAGGEAALGGENILDANKFMEVCRDSSRRLRVNSRTGVSSEVAGITVYRRHKE